MDTETKRKEYYIVSLKHTSKGDTALTFWGHNSRGYTWGKDNAGLYSKEELPSIQNEENVPVLKDEVDKFWLPGNDFNDEFISVPNNTTTQNALGLSTKFMKEVRFKSCRIKF